MDVHNSSVRRVGWVVVVMVVVVMVVVDVVVVLVVRGVS